MIHSMRNTQTSSVLPLAASAALLVACSGNVVNLGEGGERAAPPPYSLCLESATASVTNSSLPGTLLVSEQREIDQLEGCETIAGSLVVRPRFQPDLRPLHALKEIQGSLAFEDQYDPSESYDQAQAQAVFQLLEDGWVDSLEGLEGLERVGNLTLSRIAATDLSPLSGLRTLTRGNLALQDLRLRDLSALAGLRGISSLDVWASELESIADLQLESSMRWISISGALHDASALQVVETIDGDLMVQGTALTELSALSSLGSVGGSFYLSSNAALRSLNGLQSLWQVMDTLHVTANAALENMDGLQRLSRAKALDVEANEALVRLPDLFITELESITISGNPRLREIAGFPALITNSPIRANTYLRAMATPEMLLQSRARKLRISDNPALEHLIIPNGWQSIQQVAIQGNDALSDLAFGSLEAIDLLSIGNNRKLASVDLGELGSVDLLTVRDNPLLPASSFDTVKTFEREMSGNAGQ